MNTKKIVTAIAKGAALLGVVFVGAAGSEVGGKIFKKMVSDGCDSIPETEEMPKELNVEIVEAEDVQEEETEEVEE